MKKMPKKCKAYNIQEKAPTPPQPKANHKLPLKPSNVDVITKFRTPVCGPSLLIVDTSRDEEFARTLFGDLNRDILGPPGDGKIIIIDDSDDDDEAQEEGTAGIDPMAVPASTTVAPAGARVTNSDDQGSE
jgi:hypothetical protein